MDVPVSGRSACQPELLLKHRRCQRLLKSAARLSAPGSLQKLLLRTSASPQSQVQISDSASVADNIGSRPNETSSAENHERRERIDSGSHASTSAALAEEVEINLVRSPQDVPIKLAAQASCNVSPSFGAYLHHTYPRQATNITRTNLWIRHLKDTASLCCKKYPGQNQASVERYSAVTCSIAPGKTFSSLLISIFSPLYVICGCQTSKACSDL